ncbi:hypothetical protein TIFTF001_022077 [Ficus carica]|uniref:Uncharacterized protein n=1 Tax=Ficus carica TaxID=3494 RepID=A0AA88AI04_FICCA|nr:hypothetical protein TIFTF001_022077 [Ficus carica]
MAADSEASHDFRRSGYVGGGNLELGLAAAVTGDDGDAAREHDARRSSESGLESKFRMGMLFVSRGDGDNKQRRWRRKSWQGEVASESEKAAAGMAGEITDDDNERQARRDDLKPTSNRRSSHLPHAATATATAIGTESFRSG